MTLASIEKKKTTAGDVNQAADAQTVNEETEGR
jgi:hypothetical protein